MLIKLITVFTVVSVGKVMQIVRERQCMRTRYQQSCDFESNTLTSLCLHPNLVFARKVNRLRLR